MFEISFISLLSTHIGVLNNDLDPPEREQRTSEAIMTSQISEQIEFAVPLTCACEFCECGTISVNACSFPEMSLLYLINISSCLLISNSMHAM